MITCILYKREGVRHDFLSQTCYQHLIYQNWTLQTSFTHMSCQLSIMFGFKLLFSAFLLIAAESQPSSEPFRITPIMVEARSTSCPADDILESARRNTSAAVTAAIQEIFPDVDSPCGGTGWMPVVSLDLRDPSQQCPSPWAVTTSPVRSCFAPQILNRCVGTNFPMPPRVFTYNRVCGRVTGYGIHTVDAFNFLMLVALMIHI